MRPRVVRKEHFPRATDRPAEVDATGPKWPVRDVAKRLGISGARVNQLESRALDKLIVGLAGREMRGHEASLFGGDSNGIRYYSGEHCRAMREGHAELVRLILAIVESE